MNRIEHQKVLAKRALRYRYGVGRGALETGERCDEAIDETGTVLTAGLTGEEGDGKEEEGVTASEVRIDEMMAAMGVQAEVLPVHGTAQGTKADGVVRLIYENVDGLNNKISGNEKLEKEKGIIDDLEADIVCLNEHKQNLMHKDNTNGFSQFFKGGEAKVRSVAAHNKHEGKKAERRQEGGTVAMVFGQLIEQYNFDASGRDETGLAR